MTEKLIVSAAVMLIASIGPSASASRVFDYFQRTHCSSLPGSAALTFEASKDLSRFVGRSLAVAKIEGQARPAGTVEVYRAESSDIQSGGGCKRQVPVGRSWLKKKITAQVRYLGDDGSEIHAEVACSYMTSSTVDCVGG
ncbi:MAG: hypothetical protein AB7G93_03930 [Bdellovibrionales bacterium]